MHVHLDADEPLGIGDRDRLGAAVHAELGEHVLDVGADRLGADHERRRDLCLRLPVAASSSQDLALARAQACPRPACRSVAVSVPVPSGRS